MTLISQVPGRLATARVKTRENIATFSPDIATRELQDIYREPVKPELIAQRIQEIKAHGVVAEAALHDLFQANKRSAANEQNVRGVHADVFLLGMFAAALGRHIADRAFQNL